MHRRPIQKVDLSETFNSVMARTTSIQMFVQLLLLNVVNFPIEHRTDQFTERFTIELIRLWFHGVDSGTGPRLSH